MSPTALADALATLLRGAALRVARHPEGADLELRFATPPPESFELNLALRGHGGAVQRVVSPLSSVANPGGFALFVRRNLVGARVRDVVGEHNGLAFCLDRRGDAWTLRVDRSTQQLRVVDGDGRVRAVSSGRPPHGDAPARPRAVDSATPSVPDAARVAALAVLDGAADRARADADAGLRRAVRNEARRARRLVERLGEDLGRADGAEALREAGEVLKVAMHAVPAGADHIEMPVPWAPDGRVVRIDLQRDRSPAQNVERLFRRARALAVARAAIAERLEAARARTAALEALAADDVAGEDLRSAAVALGVRLPKVPTPGGAPASPRRRSPATTVPAGVDRFETESGRELLVGRSAAANDVLVTRLARGADLWLHVKDRRGAHGLLRASGKDAPPGRDLAAAACLVAWLSGVEREGTADVSWTEARNVRKSKGLAPGMVYVQKERVLRVAVERSVVDAFYARRGETR